MSILQSEIKWYKAAAMNDAGTNGGRLSAVVSASAVANNIWPDVGQAERTAGSNKYRKLFLKIDSAEDLPLTDGKVFVEQYTLGDDHIFIFPGSQTDIQSELTGSERLYGSGYLDDTALNINDTTIKVQVEDWATYPIFSNGDTIRISNKTDINDVGGTEEYLTINSVPSAVGNLVTFTVATGVANAYATGVATRVASVIPAGTVGTSLTTPVYTPAATGTGTIDDAQMSLSNLSTVEQDWTLSFTSATAFDIIGNTLGTLASGGTVSTLTQPDNPDHSSPYFTIPSAAFGGTFEAGDTITFTTTPAGYPLWYRRVVPAGANSLAGNKVIVAIDGEST